MLNAKALKNIDKDDLLGLLGLESRRTPADWMVPTVTAFAVGVAVGVGVGMLLSERGESARGMGPGTRLPGEGAEGRTGASPMASGMERASGNR
jgi:hypothetical protein